MPRTKQAELEKKTLNFYKGDWEDLADLLPDQDTSVSIRDIIHSFIVDTKARVKEKEMQGVKL